MDTSSRQKLNKETQALNDALDQNNWTDIIEHSIQKQQNTHSSSAHGTFSRTDHILGHKVSLSKLKKIDITWNIFSNHNAMRLEIN